MKLYSSLFRISLLVFAVILLVAAPQALAQAQSAAQTEASASQSSAAQTPAVPARITQAIDETQLVTLKGNVHPLARPEFDQGPVSDAMPVTRALLLLQRSPQQEAALRQLLDDQQDKSSARYHAWLTPQQFGQQFGPADSDIQTLTSWLAGHGFHDVKVGIGRTTIEFSGNVGQVRNAFHTEIHNLSVHGEAHIANMNSPQVPAALAPVIAGVQGLHNFRAKSFLHMAKNFHPESASVVGKAPAVTFTAGCGPTGSSPCYAVAPADFATIYSVPATVNGNPPGQNVTIAIVQDSNLYYTDVQQFRGLFGLSNNFSNSNIILNGPDPGVQGPTSPTFDEAEAVLDAEMSGAVAPAATINVVVSENSETIGALGIDLSAIYIIDNNFAPIMSESFGVCELESGVPAFYGALWEQAAAQGITVITSTGDNGSDVCDPIESQTTIDFATTYGLSVSGIASTPYNVALGGTDFQNGTAPSPYWATPGTTTESAISYIPESTWNSGCAATAAAGNLGTCTAAIIDQDSSNPNLDGIDIEGGSGGQSAFVARPAWQVGVTPTADTNRDLPDISLYSAVNTSSNSFIITCEADSPDQNGNACAISNNSVEITPVGGTSAAAPAFAGIMAMVVQQQGGEPKGRQGNANFVLYQLYKKDASNASLVCPSNAATATSVKNGTASCIFYDVITGNNSVACAGGSPDCSNTSAAAGQYGVLADPANKANPAYLAVAGYDKATGLGSVNVTNLLKAWPTATFTADTPAITAFPSGTIAHGTSASFTVKITPTGAGTPSGNVSLIASPPSPPAPAPQVGISTDVNGNPLTLSGGSVTFQTNLLPGGTDYSVIAQYGGDGTFAPGQSAPVNVTVSLEPSQTTITMWTFSGNQVLSENATTAAYGSPYILRVDVTNSSGQSCSASYPLAIPCPTGQVSVTDNGTALNDFSSPNSTLPPGTTTLVSGVGFFEDQPVQLPGGSNALVATYIGSSSGKGDGSYANSTSATNTVTITPATTATTVTASPTSGVTTTTSVTLTANIATQSSGAGPTGSVTFSANGTSIGSANVVPTAASGLNTASPVAAFGTATLTHTFSSANTYTISASYPGDNNYSNSASSGAGNATVTVTSGTTGNFTVSGAAVTVTAGSSGMSLITVTPSNGFTGTVNVTCGTALPGVTCTPNPLAINITSASQVASNLTVNVAAPSTTLSASAAPLDRNVYAAGLTPPPGGGKGWWLLSGATGLLAILLFFVPGRRRLRHAIALGLASVCVMSFALGCGGSSSGPTGPVATTTQLTISAAKLGLNSSLTVSATVTGGTPTGNVQFVVDGASLGNSVPITNGTTGPITVTAAQAPAFLQLIGTHTLSAHYLGDTNTQPSQSGTLDVTITGTANLPITGASGSANAGGNISLTIN